MAKKTNNNDPIAVLAAGDPIIVTPESPLTVTSTPVTYEAVIIRGGDINVNVGANVTFNSITKES
jgi:hypothetical protein